MLEKVFILAEEHATTLGSKYIAVNHLLLGMFELEEVFSLVDECGGEKENLELCLKQAAGGGYSGGEVAPGEFEYLSKYTIDFTQRARDGDLDPVIGRDEEIRLVMQVLSRRMKNNPLVVVTADRLPAASTAEQWIVPIGRTPSYESRAPSSVPPTPPTAPPGSPKPPIFSPLSSGVRKSSRSDNPARHSSQASRDSRVRRSVFSNPMSAAKRAAPRPTMRTWSV